MSALERGGPTLQPSAAVLLVWHGLQLHLHICAPAMVFLGEPSEDRSAAGTLATLYLTFDLQLVSTIAPRTVATLLYALTAITKHPVMRDISPEGSSFECMLREACWASACQPITQI